MRGTSATAGRGVGLRFALVLGFVGFITSFGAHVVAVNLPVYAQVVGVSVAVIGLLIAAYDLAEIVAKPLFGAIADRRGMKQTMLAGIVLFTLASLAYPLVDPRLLIVVRFVQGAGAAALSAVSLALVGAYYQERRGRAYGVYNAIKGAGYVVSPAVGTAIVARSHFATIFLVSAAIGALGFVLSLTLPKPAVDRAELDDDDAFQLSSLVVVFRRSDLWPWYLVTVVNMFLVGILFGFLPVRVHDLGYGPVATGIVLTAATATYLLVQPLAGVLADRVRPEPTVYAGLALAAVAVLTLGILRDAPLFVATAAAGAGIGVVWTNTDALFSGWARSGQLGATMGAAGSFKEFGDMLGPLLIGLLAQLLGLSTAFAICGALGLAAVVLVIRSAPPRAAE
ncbi:MFS transporter [Candidatus Nephthysia bennettiae]|uniref:MFS transporter n=1 Tax=Candidatus Nephthysia bennettiae TaxID=3127016 RepID=A0A934N377_9BACT|nr:MFS transporter [Candidatus Dormibacteraeota bacterium]MBJ7607132.1 MFS transporter [Candidatus Dormibacteraeota bacterium]MBJ7613679.1 MFS transporter [Candidatus Dormibacteraeota bacterium]